MKKSCVTDVMGIFENTGAENQSAVQDQRIRHRQAATPAPRPSAASSSAGTSSFSLIYCSPRAPVEPLIVSLCWDISAEASIA